MSVVASLPSRPLSHAEAQPLREDDRVLDVTYTFDDAEQPVLVSLIVDSGAQRHLVAYHRDNQRWEIVWEGADPSDGDPVDAAESWAREVYGWSASQLFNLPGAGREEGL